MATMKDRIIAGTGAFVFFLSIIALTVTVLVTMAQESKQKDTAATDPQTADTCQAPGSAEVLTAPEPFTVEQKVDSLEKTDVTEGTGSEAKTGDCLVMKYYGTLASTGDMFDENFTQPSAFAFKLGEGRVIQGWDQGLVGIKEGGVRRLVIPATLAYGEQSPSEKIPANSDLVFVVKLVSIKK
jgi:FKBP-type peptidyl-prolyl cis-trans isomerase